MRRILKYFYLCFILAGFGGCKKVPDRPPIADTLGHKFYSVDELKAIAKCNNGCSKTFTADVYFNGIVIADAQSGNFYKEIYLRDRYNTGGIHLDFTYASNFWVGDSVRVNLKGLNVSINPETDILEIDSLDWEKYCVKFAKGVAAQPHVLSIAQYTSNMNRYLGDLIQVSGVSFRPNDADQFWADEVGQNSLNRTLEDCLGAQLIVRTSNFAKFASEKTPTGNGTIIGIATAYNGDAQMEIRTPAEANMTGSGCQVYLKKDFNDSKISNSVTPTENWLVVSVTNTAVLWTPYTFGVDKFARINGYISGNTTSECWMISPPMNLSASNNPVFTFRTAANFSGPILKVKVSTDYTSGAPSSATWTDLSPNLSSSSYSWTPSGSIQLSGFKSANTRVAFTYSSSATGGSKVYEVDDVLVKEN